jgi:hypothetical protein
MLMSNQRGRGHDPVTVAGRMRSLVMVSAMGSIAYGAFEKLQASFQLPAASFPLSGRGLSVLEAGSWKLVAGRAIHCSECA